MPAPEGWYVRDGKIDPKVAPPAALAIAVPFESSGLVPDLSPGASQAVQTAAGLALLSDLSEKPLDRPVLLIFGGADSLQMLATRQALMAFADVPALWREQLETLGKTDRKSVV